MTGEKRDLELRFHGRIVDQLASQTYQSPISATAEMVANGWDADAGEVTVSLPPDLGPDSEMVISDNGDGMTFEEVQDRYLEVGYNRRGTDPKAVTAKGRPLMGRKGIGKFAGFGIADRMVVDTTSGETGERTRFTLDFHHLRGDSDEYIDREPTEIPEVEWWPGNDASKADHGTRITLSRFKLKITPSSNSTKRSLARRFLLLERAGEFTVLVDGIPIADEEEGSGVQFRYPEEWPESSRPEGLSVVDGWGIEEVAGKTLKWQCVFYNEPIRSEDLRGFAVFAHNKLAQSPFFFDATGGTEGQAGQEYLSGKMEASFLDDGEDIISIERQRIDWKDDTAAAVLSWGQSRLKKLLAMWSDRRTEAKVRLLDEKVARFSPRLERLPKHERRIIDGAIRNLARVKALNNEQFVDLSEATLTAWEGGRLKELISDMDGVADMSEGELLSILLEHQALNALSTAETVKVKKQVIDGLRERIEDKELENAVRDYVAKSPWLIDPKWDTYKVEQALKTVVDDESKKRFSPPMLDKRVDLVLSSGSHVLLLEFQRPGNKIDGDHLSRFALYVNAIRAYVEANTAGPFKDVTGYIVADRIEDDAAVSKMVQEHARNEMFAMDWKTLLDGASRHWSEFFDAVVERSPDDPRVLRLKGEGAPGAVPDADAGENQAAA